MHIAPGVDEDEHADAGRKQRDEQGEPVDVENERGAKRRRPRHADAPANAGQEEVENGAERDQRDGRGVVGRSLAGHPEDERRQRRRNKGPDDEGDDERLARLHGRPV